MTDDLIREYAMELSRIDRASVPPSVRDLLPEERGPEYYEGLLVGSENSQKVVRLAAAVLPKARPRRRHHLELRYRGCRLVICDRMLRLAPANFAFLAVMAVRRRTRQDFVAYDTPTLREEYLHEYCQVNDDDNGIRVKRTLERDGVERSWFDRRKSLVNREIRTLGLLGSSYLIRSEGTRPNTRYGLTVDPDCIRIHGRIIGFHPGNPQQ